MNDLNQNALQDLARERAKIFTPQWFIDLFAGRLGFGDTFWLGNYGVLMFIVPMVVLISGLFYAQSAPAMLSFLRVFAALFGLWSLAIAAALWRAKGRLGRIGGWGWAGLVWTAGTAVYAFFTAATL